MAMTPATTDLPDPSTLNVQGGCWFPYLPAVSSPTAPQGDWKVWPHMQSKDNWLKTMGLRAGVVARFLESRNIGYDSCSICAAFGRGVQSGFEGHVGGHWHFKHWCRLCADGEDMSVARERHWQSWNVHGGAIRFNHADGEVQMCKGYPPTSPAPMAAAVPGMTAPGALPAAQQAPSAQAAITAMVKANPRSAFELCTEENRWYILIPHIGHPSDPKGDINSCHWLSTKNTWKPAIRPSVEIVESFLHSYDIYPECMLCPTGVGFAEHAPAEKHLRKLQERVPAGVPVVECAKSLWQEWQVPHGIIKLNHCHGQVWICRGK
ncbi:unnamed protein product, partial [Effrenium voratum]